MSEHLKSLGVLILLAALCWLIVGCASIPVRRTYSITYGDAKASVTLEPSTAPTK